MRDPDDSMKWFLHRMDAKAGFGSYVSTTSNMLRNTAFIDGRKQFWSSEEVRPLDLEISDSADAISPQPCYIFHVSFCGSTLLSQLLDQQEQTLVLREPQALVDLSTQQSSIASRGPNAMATLSNFAIREIGLLRKESETLVIKPSNWANSLVPILCHTRTRANAVFLSMGCTKFVIAVFRGGRDRLVYTARAAAHLTETTGLGVTAMQIATARSEDPLDQIACYAALSHRVQEHIFKLAMKKRNWDDTHWFDLAHIVADPVAVAKSVATVLDLNNDKQEIERQALRFSKVHSKDQTMTYSTQQHLREDETVKLLHEDRIERAVAWAAAADL